MRFTKNNRSITTVTTNKESYTPDEVVLASGSWTQQLGKSSGNSIYLYNPEKATELMYHRPLGIVLPAVLMEAKVAVTPMQGFTRFAGTMELSGINHTIRTERVRAIAKAARITIQCPHTRGRNGPGPMWIATGNSRWPSVHRSDFRTGIT